MTMCHSDFFSFKPASLSLGILQLKYKKCVLNNFIFLLIKSLEDDVSLSHLHSIQCSIIFVVQCVAHYTVTVFLCLHQPLSTLDAASLLFTILILRFLLIFLQSRRILSVIPKQKKVTVISTLLWLFWTFAFSNVTLKMFQYFYLKMCSENVCIVQPIPNLINNLRS